MHDGILIWGAGAIGGTLGAYLARAGQDVTFVDIVPEHVAAIQNGLYEPIIQDHVGRSRRVGAIVWPSPTSSWSVV